MPDCGVLKSVKPKDLPAHVGGLLSYLSQPAEKANEDLALSYFRATFGQSFQRQKEAHQSDGYVPGHFVLELKGKENDWLSGLFQGLAYRTRGLDFTQVVVGAKGFLAVWRTVDIPERILEELSREHAAPNFLGRKYAKKYAAQKSSLLKRSIWNGSDLFTPLFSARPDVVLTKFRSFEKALRDGRRVRQRITAKNFTTLFREMKSFFDPSQPMKAVRAFYSMLYSWDETSTVNISQKATDQATLGGELITDLIPAKRTKFKEFVEDRFVSVGGDSSFDEYFARYDQALDAADKSFRVKHGIFFTDLDLSRFVMWFVRQHIPNLGKSYLVIDPACGSGNLVTNWRSPLELRHKVVSEIEPELLFAVEKRMKGDAWHNGRFTVIPKVSENRGLNFLNCSADEYLDQVQQGLEEKGLTANKPLAFLCNPPYRSDDDQTAGAVGYQVHPSILELTGVDGANERYCCFLAQMKLICETAKESGLPGESLLILFTKSTWLTKRPNFQSIRSQILGSFEHVAGALVKADEFFDVKGTWPVAFTVWRYRGPNKNLDPHRSVTLTDLTWITKRNLSEVSWSVPDETDSECAKLVSDVRAIPIELGLDRQSIREWSASSMVDFKRDRRKLEKNAKIAGGLPTADRRQANKKVYGEQNGHFIGFMDDLTPCRIKQSTPNRPWLNLDSRFMAVKKSRCFSGPPTHLGYCATDLETAKKLFFWYALGRTFVQRHYPIWIDADGMWAPSIPKSKERQIFQMAFAIAYAENECVETRFPANNPLNGVPEIIIRNPMTPLDSDSFWSRCLMEYLGDDAPKAAQKLVVAVDSLFEHWRTLFRSNPEIEAPSQRPYFIGVGKLTKTAGLVQISDFGQETDNRAIIELCAKVQVQLKAAKDEFFDLVSVQLKYFTAEKSQGRDLAPPEKTKFEKALCRRLAISGLLVHLLHKDAHFGRTKLTKLFYLSDVHEGFDLETNYFREAAGPLDQRALYNENFGIEAMGRKYRLFETSATNNMLTYAPSTNMKLIREFSEKHLGNKAKGVIEIAKLFKGLTTDQSEIVATLYACWNDMLLQKRAPSDDDIINEFLHHWHPKKSRFSRARLSKAIAWMRDKRLVPSGKGRPTTRKAAAH